MATRNEKLFKDRSNMVTDEFHVRFFVSFCDLFTFLSSRMFFILLSSNGMQ